jgi:alpha-tubulin suppressor-like RCC1 family protein
VQGATHGCEFSWRGRQGPPAVLQRLALLTAVTACCVGVTAPTAGAAGANPYGPYYPRHRGGVVAWGGNGAGELGIGTTSGPQVCWYGPCSAVPVGVSKLTGVHAVASGGTHGLALIRNGHVWAWGSNEYGELGDNSVQASAVPVKVCAPAPQTTQPAGKCEHRLLEATAISAQYYDSLALLRDGTVVAWGNNERGQLGDGSTADSDVPVTVCAVGETAAPCTHPLSGVVAISAGYGFALALLNDGTVVAWGDNQNGELGDGGTTDSSVPVPVGGLTNVKAIAAGGVFGFALLDDGTVRDWGALGENYFGPVQSLTPVPVEGLPQATAIAAGGGFRLALLTNGTVDSWGQDGSGELGVLEECVPDVMCRSHPGPVPGLGEVSAISAGGSNALALLSNGTVMAWGSPEDGQIGNDAFVWQLLYHSGLWADGAATPVCALSEVGGISSGGSLSLAYGKDGPGVPCTPEPVLRSGSPNSGPAGTPVTIVGDNFTGATKVTFYEERANASFTVVSPTEILAIAPAAPLEEGHQPRGYIHVTTPVGEARGMKEPNGNLFDNGDPKFLLEEPAVEEAQLPAPQVARPARKPLAAGHRGLGVARPFALALGLVVGQRHGAVARVEERGVA